MAASEQFCDRPDASDVDFSFAELKRGLALLDIADLTNNPKTRRQVTAAAEKIYRSVVRLSPPSQDMTKEDTALRQQLELRLAVAASWTLCLPDSLRRKTFHAACEFFRHAWRSVMSTVRQEW